jgi:N-acetylgalactosamine-6-sulfatase
MPWQRSRFHVFSLNAAVFMKFALTHLTALLLAPLGILHGVDAPTQKPNIIFIYADDWGWGDLSCHGSTWLKTPNLDKLASQGTDFQQFNVLNPVCSPSRAAVMTGLYPARLSVHQHFATPEQNHERGMPDWLDPKAHMLPRLLKQAGYRTAHFGKWHLTNRDTEGAPKPEAYGYDEARVFNGGAGWESADLHATASDTAAFIKANRTQPFFINAWLHESHTPHVPTAESMEKWKHLDEQKQVYAAVITDGDNAVGTILDALKAEGLEENTIVMFSSDNGPESTAAKRTGSKFDPDANVTGYDTFYSVGETGGLRGRKRSLFEGGVRVPFIVRWPGHTPAGAKNDTTVFTAVDLLPTLCAAASVTLPADYQSDGENLLAAFQGKTTARTRPLFWHWMGKAAEPDYWPRLAVREGDWKLVLTEDGKRVELHHLSRDRAETEDVSKDHPDIVARLSQMAREWKATLPAKPNPECLSQQPLPAKPTQAKPGAKSPKVTPEVRAKAFARWDTNQDDILTLEEYQTGLKGQSDLESRYKSFDQNGDGKLTRAEFIGK